MANETEKFAADVKAWIAKVKSQVQSKVPVLDEFKGSLKLKYGIPERVRLTFPRHYIFREKGVGKGRKIGSGKETPKPVINPVLEANINELADIAAENTADIAASRLFIK